MTLGGDTGDDGIELAEVDLRFLAGLMGLRHHDFGTRFAVFQPPSSLRVRAHRCDVGDEHRRRLVVGGRV
jgi:hypothetical protein